MSYLEWVRQIAVSAPVDPLFFTRISLPTQPNPLRTVFIGQALTTFPSLPQFTAHESFLIYSENHTRNYDGFGHYLAALLFQAIQ